MPSFRFSVAAKLAGGFVAGTVFVGVILFSGDRLLREASRGMQQTLSEHVQPLAQVHRLQSRLDSLRNFELELPKIRDYFTLPSFLDRMRGEVLTFDAEISAFGVRMGDKGAADARRLAAHWKLYRQHLEQQLAAASAFDMAAVESISNTASFIPHTAIAELLGEAARATEAAAEAAYRQAVAGQERQRQLFLASALATSILLALYLAFVTRSLVGRVARLRESATRIAAGEERGVVEVSGSDEIADLGQAFGTMQDIVAAREQSLRAAHEELEQRVQARTRELTASNARLRLMSEALEQSPVGIAVTDTAGLIQHANAAFTWITGFTAEALVGRDLAEVVETGQPSGSTLLRECLAAGRDWEGEVEGQRADGTPYWQDLHLVTVRDPEGRAAYRLLVLEDVTRRRTQEEKIAYQAHYDALTGLPNRVLAFDRLVQAITRAQRESGKVVLMFIDLDNFKQVNDTLGHAVGDAMLQQAAERLRGSVRSEDTVARLGGDEFLVTMEMAGPVRAGGADAVAGKIIRAFAQPFLLEGRELVTTPSIGLAVYPDDGSEPTVLLRNADLAMYEAKDAGRNTYRFFNQAIHDMSLQRLEIERCLRGALERGELELHYQPQCAAGSGTLIGAEALLRWHSPELGRMAPDRFIPVAEQSGLIVAIGEWVLREACAQAARWRSLRSDFVVAVNVSPRQFRSAGFVETVRACIGRSGLAPQQLEIEITEGLLIGNPAEVREILAALDGLGVRLAMDDFGTGYSSLSYLREFPFRTVKIDRSFIRDISDDLNSRALVLAAIRMAKALGLKVVAEGVENEAQRQFLTSHACDVLQGHLLCTPVPAAEFEAVWLRQPRVSAS